MKRIEAYLQPHRLTEVIRALHELARFPGLTVIDAQGQGHGRGPGGHFAYEEDELIRPEHKLLLVICEDAEAGAIARLIAATAHTGNRGDGIVVISDIVEILHIREAIVRDPSADDGGSPGDAGGESAP